MFAWTVATGAVLAAVALAFGLDRMRRRARDLARDNLRLHASADVLSAASQARSRFLATMSHEIRTPLTGIVGFAEVLADETLSPAGRRAVDRIQRSARSLQALLGDILDFSRIDAGALTMQRRPTDLTALLDEIHAEFAPQARQRGLVLSLSVSPGARRWAMTDPLRLRQVLVNLVSNAIRYTEAGMIRLAAATDPDDRDTVLIRVTDTGIGIAPDDRRRIFDAFARAAEGDAVQSGGGVGLGLAIAGGLVAAMGGSLTLDSTPGEGSTFTVALPLPSCPAAPVPPRIAGPAPAAAPARILLVDDVAMNRELFAAMLAGAGHRVTSAANGAAALRCLKRSRFDLAFVDIQMPSMDGYELTRRIRASDDPTVSRLPVVALSAAAYGEDRTRAQEAGMNDYVTKPATREEIAAAVDRARAGDAAPEAAAPEAAAPEAGALADAAPEPEVLDRAAFEQQRATFGDDRVLRFLTMLAEELDRCRAAIDEAAGRDSRSELGQHAHAIASAAGNLGFRQLMLLGRAFERDVAGLSHEDLAFALDQLRRSLADTGDAITFLAAEVGTRPIDRRAAG